MTIALHKQTQFDVPVQDGDAWILPPPDRMGNCFATCVACLLRLSPQEVPNFVAEPVDWWSCFQDWLSERSMYAIEVEHKDEHYLWPVPEGIYCIINGKSPRGDCNHSVIARTESYVGDGGDRCTRFMYHHDPHPSNEFVGEVRSITFLARK